MFCVFALFKIVGRNNECLCNQTNTMRWGTFFFNLMNYLMVDSHTTSCHYKHSAKNIQATLKSVLARN